LHALWACQYLAEGIERRLLTYSETTLALDVDLDQVSPLKDVLDEQHLDGPVLRTHSSETEFVDA
jgi:hypothetical protein